MSEASPRPVPAYARYTALVLFVIVAGGLLVKLGLVVFAGQEYGLRRFASPALTAYGAWRAWRGHQDGVTTLFWLFVLAVVAVTLVLAFESPRPPLIWVGVAVSAGGLGVFGWAKFGPLPDDSTPERYQYRHLQEDAGASPDEWLARRDAQLREDDRNPPDCDALVESLLETDDVDMVRARLVHQGERALPAICQALAEAAFLEDEDAGDMLRDILPYPPPLAAADGLAAFCDESDGFDLYTAFDNLAAIGRADDAEILMRGLLDEDTSGAVVAGLRTALEHGTADAGLMEALNPELRRIVPRADADEDARRDAAIALSRKDPSYGAELARALPTASAPLIRIAGHVEREVGGIGASAFRPLWDEAMARRDFERLAALTAHAGLGESHLLELTRRCASNVEADHAGSAYAEGLRLLRESGSREAQAEIERAANTGNSFVQNEAARELCLLHGIPDEPIVDEDARDTPQARHVSSLRWLITYTASGGLIHAFSCLDETDAASLPEALETVAPPLVQDIVRRGVELLASGPLPVERSEREQLIKRRFSAIEDELDGIEDEFFAVTGQLEWAIARYCVQHSQTLAGAFYSDSD